MLHITNGDCAAGVIGRTGIPGPVLPWRDVLHEGPVSAGLELADLSDVRARFLADEGYAPLAQLREEFAHRDAALAASVEHDEVVLWFEHDLYDQLQLVQLLDWFSQQARCGTQLRLVCEREYLGESSPERLSELFAARCGVTAAQLALGRAAWEAFRSPDPASISRLLLRDTAPLPFLAGALERHMEQFPATVGGLSRSERQVLEAVAEGANSPAAAFAASQAREEAIFLGDATFARYLDGLGGGRQPLLAWEDGSRLAAQRGGVADEAFWRRRMRLTDCGRDILAGRADQVAFNGIDRWLGGVHLRGAAPWRWDVAAKRLRAP